MPRSILEFQSRFVDEDDCRRYLFESRWPEGFTCPRCESTSAGGQPKRRLWECRECGSGGLPRGDPSPVHLRAAAATTARHRPLETAWLILHKLRRAMVAPERSRMQGPVEVDEFYVGGIEAGRAAGRKSNSTKAIVVVAVELRGQGSGRLRLGVVADLSNASLCGFVDDAIEPAASGAPLDLQLQRLAPRTHRDVSREHLQVYLDESDEDRISDIRRSSEVRGATVLDRHEWREPARFCRGD